MEQRKRRQYTLEERQAVVRDIDEHGVLGAAKKHGVPQSCVSRWASAAQAERAKVRSETTRDATMEPSLGTKRLPVTPAGVMSEKVRSRAAKLYTPSQKAQVLEHVAAHGVTAAALAFNISRFSIYDWQHKLAKAAKGEGASPTSGPAPSGFRRFILEQRDKLTDMTLDDFARATEIALGTLKDWLRTPSTDAAVSGEVSSPPPTPAASSRACTSRLCVSTAGGTDPDAQPITPEYWQRQLRETVLFGDAVRRAHERGVRTFIEIGPKAQLLSSARRNVEGEALWLAASQGTSDSWPALAQCLSSMYCTGYDIDWHAFDAGHARECVALPSYPFERVRCWLDETSTPATANTTTHATTTTTATADLPHLTSGLLSAVARLAELPEQDVSVHDRLAEDLGFAPAMLEELLIGMNCSTELRETLLRSIVRERLTIAGLASLLAEHLKRGPAAPR